MPALRSDKGKAASKAKAATRPRQHLKDNVDPCEICGVVVSRKSDVPRHAKTHASDAEKLPCPWEGCTFRTLQKSNLDTHYRRHTQDRSYNCTDDPACKFQTCDPASLLRHRKRLHGYTPRASVGYKDEKPYKHVHVRVIRGIEADSGSVASQFSMFSSGASTSGSTSSTPASRSSPPDSLSPSPSPSPSPSLSSTPSPSPSPPHSSSRLPPRPRSFSPANSSGESEVSSSPPTPVASTSDREVTPEIPSPTVLSMTSSPIYQTGKSLLFSDSLLLPHTKNYAWGLSLDSDTPELLNVSVTSSPVSSRPQRLEVQHPEEETNDLPVLDELDFLHLPLQFPDMEKVWPGYETEGQLNGSEGLDKKKIHQKSSEVVEEEPNNQITFGVSINGSPFLQSDPHLPFGLFQRSSSSDLYDFNCKPEMYSPASSTLNPVVLDPLGLEIGFVECGGNLGFVGSGSVEPTLSSTLGANPASSMTHYHNLTIHTTLVDIVDPSIAGDQIITDTNIINAEFNFINVNDNVNLNHYGSDTSNGDLSSSSSHTIPNHLNISPSQWNVLGLDEGFAEMSHAGVVKDVDEDILWNEWMLHR